jgi:hypothetical protein
MSVTLFNPLPIALAHYADEMAQTLSRLGIDTKRLSPSPSTDARGVSRLRRVAAHMRAVHTVKGSDSWVLILWPSLGWAEPALWSSRSGASMIVIHDPVPLRRQYGLGALGRILAQVTLGRTPPRLICHTLDAALSTANQLGLDPPPPVCLHPILTAAAPEGPGAVSASSGTILVAGQHKPTRDMALLSELGPRLRATGYRPRIVGSGWPPVDGWEVRNEFLTETELEREIRGSDGVLIPYHRYWQSGIAIRAVEAGVPTVGVETSFLRTLMGDGYPGFVHSASEPDAWLGAIEAVTARFLDMDRRRAGYQRKVDRSWAAQLGQFVDPPSGGNHALQCPC